MRRERVTTSAANHHGARAEPVDFLASLPDFAFGLTWDAHRDDAAPIDDRVATCAGVARKDPSRRASHAIPAVHVANLRIAVAESREEIEAAHGLVRTRYSWRGYVVETPAPDSDAAGAKQPSVHEFTIVAANHEATIGTCTVGIDGPHGLRADGAHGHIIQKARENGRRVGEITRLAIADRVDSKPVLASLFNLAYLAAKTNHGVTDVFIEVNPRHVAFYSRVLGFVVAAGETFCERVRAPSVLLHVEMDALAGRLVALAERALPEPAYAEAA